MASNLWLQLVQAGSAADRPVNPDPTPGAANFYWATDTQTLSVYDVANGAWTEIGVFTGSAPVKLPAFAVANLPSAAAVGEGAMAYATDLTSTTAGSTATGGGTSKAIVVSDGTNWLVA